MQVKLMFEGKYDGFLLGPHHCIIWNQVTELVLSLVLVPPLDGDRRI